MSTILLRRVVVPADDSGGRAYDDSEFVTNRLTIGTRNSNDLRLEEPQADSLLAEIILDQRVTLRSTGVLPVTVNGSVIESCWLQVGDTIEIGNSVIQVILNPPGFAFALEMTVQLADRSSHLTDIAGNAKYAPARYTWWTVGLIVALLLLVPLLTTTLSSADNTAALPVVMTDQMWSSGELSAAHQQATQGDCRACHETLFQRVQNEQCGQCHTDTAKHHLLAKDPATAVQVDAQPARCASCHREHNGHQQINTVIDADCRNCHEQSGFPDGHTEFADFPHAQHTNLEFDHTAHQQTHYGKTEKSFVCGDCHSQDKAGQYMLTRRFESMCIDCHGQSASTKPDKVLHHGQQISASKPIAFVTLPRLDMRTLRQRNIDIGHWPEGAARGSRSGLTPLGLTYFTELLLLSDAPVAAALQQLKNDKVKLAKLRKASAQSIENVLIVVAGLKRLMAELAVDPGTTLSRRLQVDGRLREAMLSRLNPQLVEAVFSRWFSADPLLAEQGLQGYLNHGAKDAVPGFVEPAAGLQSGTTPVTPVPGLPGVNSGHWHAAKFSLTYNVRGHADAFVSAWISLASQRGDAAGQALLDNLVDAKAKPGKSKSPGRCTKCHILPINQSGSEGLAGGAWTPVLQTQLEAAVPRHGVTFSHRAHLFIEDGCVTCHTESTDKGTDFAQMDLATCSDCHRAEGSAGDTCVTCHDYHVQPVAADAIHQTFLDQFWPNLRLSE